MSDPGGAVTERRLQALLDRLAVEEDPKEAARLMREHARLSAGLPGLLVPSAGVAQVAELSQPPGAATAHGGGTG